MANRAGVSHTAAHRLGQAHALQPHRVETLEFTTGPKAEAKIHDIVGLYLNPPSKAVVSSLDEQTQIQALNRTQPILPLRPGLPMGQTHAHEHNGLTSRHAGLEVASGQVLGECRERHTGLDFLAFIKRGERRYRRRELHVILDDSSTHSAPAVKDWLELHPRVHFNRTPTGASWISRVEAWFGILTRKSIRRGSFTTVRSLVRHITSYIEHWNEGSTPSVWAKQPADIIRKPARR